MSRRIPDYETYPQSWRGVAWLIRDMLRDMRWYYIGRRVLAIKRRFGWLPPPPTSKGTLTPYNLESNIVSLQPCLTPVRDYLWSVQNAQKTRRVIGSIESVEFRPIIDNKENDV